MRIRHVYLRFYKSFNVDYLRKAHPEAKPDPWDELDGTFQPYVRIPVEDSITAVVGANESGKSQFLGAVRALVERKPLQRSEFCRYSNWFTVERGRNRVPDVGVELYGADDAVQERWAESFDVGIGAADRILCFIENGGPERWYVRRANGAVEPATTRTVDESFLSSVLPRLIDINAKVPLPDSIPLTWLGTKNADPNRAWIAGKAAFDAVAELPDWFSSTEHIKKLATAFQQKLSPEDQVDQEKERQFKLARKLLLDVANVEPTAFDDLLIAIRNGDEGFASGITKSINRKLEEALNFPRHWAQDRKFQLLVSAREFDLVFTIQDRTESEYSFKERSDGLRYFLSYYVQFLAEPTGGTPPLVLMDEPDAYLSGQGQQDLLRVFQDFAQRHDAQIVYVTHSPFLIDKNHADRIKVLEKGSTDEGTRVVRDVSRNHYEPLRSSIGTFVGETAFIGTVNLFLEGTADQIILAGISAWLRSLGAASTHALDLNLLTLVPAGSAGHIPHLVYLARGRDVEKPAVTVLLDTDSAGDAAYDDLVKGTPRGRRLIPDEFILRIGRGTLGGERFCVPEEVTVRETEDLIPLETAAAAGKRYMKMLIGDPADLATKLTAERLKSHLSPENGVFNAVQAAVIDLMQTERRVDKVGFARSLVEELKEMRGEVPGEDDLRANFSLLFQEVNAAVRRAYRQNTEETIGTRLNRDIRGFVKDHRDGATREKASILFEDIDAFLDDSAEADAVRLELQSLRREFDLDDDIGSIISEWSKFQERLTQVRYKAKLDSQDPPRDEPSAPPQKGLTRRRGGRNSRAGKRREPAPTEASELIGAADSSQQG